MSSKINSKAIANVRLFRFISYGLVFLMIVCIVMTINGLIQNTLPDWSSGIITGVMLFITMDRLYTYHRFKHLQLFSSEWAITIGTQWIVIILFIRLFLSYVKGPDAFLNDMLLFAHGSIENFFSSEFVVTLLLTIFAWYLSRQFLELLDEIGPDQVLASLENEAVPRSEVVPVQRRLVNLVFSTGILLVILVALTRIDLRAIFSDTAGSAPANLNQLSTAE